MTPTVNIVGAGPGGLATAMLLAAQGVRVRLFEKQETIGGRTGRLQTPQGYGFDVGPTFFMYPEALREIFSAAGMKLEDRVDLRRLDPHYDLRYAEGGSLRVTPNVEQMEAEIARLSPVDAANLPAYLKDNREKLQAFLPILQRPFSGLKDLLDPALIPAIGKLRPWASIDSDLKRFFSDPRVRLAFSFQSKYLGMSPFRCPSLFSIFAFLEYEYGVFHPIGGCHALMQAMATAGHELDVEFHLGEPVEHLDFDGKKCIGLRTALDSYPADATVVNADFAHAIPHLIPQSLRRRWTNKAIAKKKYSCSTFMLYLGLEGRTESLEHHTIWLTENYRENLRDIEDRHCLTERPSFYVQNATRTDPTLAPDGHSTLYVLVPVTHQHPNVDWQKESRRYRDQIFGQLADLGVEDLQKRLRFEKVVTPDDWQNDLSIHRGATFNLAHSFDQMLHLRPNNRFEDVDGVYLVGGGTHPGSGLPVIFESAKISSTLLLEDLGKAGAGAPSRTTTSKR